jgi:hypothetical protein
VGRARQRQQLGTYPPQTRAGKVSLEHAEAARIQSLLVRENALRTAAGLIGLTFDQALTAVLRAGCDQVEARLLLREQDARLVLSPDELAAREAAAAVARR